MGAVVLGSLWAWVILVSGVCSVPLPEISEEKFIEDCVDEHNSARSSVAPPATDMRYMTWDEGLAITARAWARRCTFEHNIYLRDAHRMHPDFSSVGENIWTGYPPLIFNSKKAIQSWVNEVQHYDYHANNCTQACGQYTQVVWASSYKVGCAVQVCPNGVSHFTYREGVVFVCNYAPAGINGRRPYASQREACSGCNGTCENRLCRSQERDKPRSYDWTPDWDTTSNTRGSDTSGWKTRSLKASGLKASGLDTSGSNYVTILIARPIAFVFTLTTAFVVHYFYPDVFFYE